MIRFLLFKQNVVHLFKGGTFGVGAHKKWDFLAFFSCHKIALLIFFYCLVLLVGPFWVYFLRSDPWKILEIAFSHNFT